MSNKIVKTDSAIAHTTDFVKKIEEELRKAQDKPAYVDIGRCWASFKFENDLVSPCLLSGEHSVHRNRGIEWNERCESVSNGERCRYQLKHVGKHVDPRGELIWENDPYSLKELGGLLQASPAFQQAIADQIAARAPVVKMATLNKARSLMFGFGPYDIEAGKILTMTVKPACYFRGERFVNEGDTDGLFLMQIVVGARLQMPVPTTAGNGVWVKFYDGNVLGTEMRLDTCQPAQEIALIVENRSKETRKFAMALYGKGIV